MYRPTVEDMTHTAQFQQLSCAEAGKFDHAQKPPLRERLTGWGKVCKERAGKGRLARKRAAREG